MIYIIEYLIYVLQTKLNQLNQRKRFITIKNRFGTEFELELYRGKYTGKLTVLENTHGFQ